MSSAPSRRLPELTNAGLKATANVIACNEYNQPVEGAIAVERALTIYLDKREIVTLMTLGNHPELLILGWLRNQRMIEDIEAIKSIQVDWEIDAVAITTHDGVANLDAKLDRKTVTTGCGQGTVFGDLMEDIDQIQLRQPLLKQSSIYALLQRNLQKRRSRARLCAVQRGTGDRAVHRRCRASQRGRRDRRLHVA